MIATTFPILKRMALQQHQPTHFSTLSSTLMGPVEMYVCRVKYPVLYQVELVHLISVRKVLKAGKVSLKVLLEMILLYKSKTTQVT